MKVINVSKSSEYFDSLVNEREDSAVSVIHGAWLEHSSTLGRLEHLESKAPLDMLVLYQAAAATFKDWAPKAASPEELLPGGRVINREQARQCLQSVQDPDQAALATRFANQVIALSGQAATEQDLHYYVELFLRSIADKRVIEGILSGEISSHDDRLADPDYW
jgi:hypothetical protein